MTFGILGNTGKPAIRNVVTGLFSFLQKRKLPYIVHDSLGTWLNQTTGKPVVPSDLIIPEQSFAKQCDIVISLGGDGTMLATARMIGESGIPILGVNLGKLGFLAEVSVDELYECVDDITAGNYFIDERMTLQAAASADTGKKYSALNDIVIDRGSSPRVIDLETTVNDDFLVTYSADGIIIATPTGSTAYSLASGGPIAVPHSGVIIITPISPHTLSARPVIVGGDSIIRVAVRARGTPIHISGDAQCVDSYPSPVEFTIRRGDYAVKLVKRKKRTYFDLLRTKLMWGRDVRMENTNA